ncbi:P-type ATPase [Actinomortierella ambigua]|uniref:P-type ATPase n=1 Tax=Actinomortierella ambigua TaxID=1343610 RepID=A0A9P6PRW8_9FUNG|nr:P-type ATPase [Actinomortierella ambigua]
MADPDPKPSAPDLPSQELVSDHDASPQVASSGASATDTVLDPAQHHAALTLTPAGVVAQQEQQQQQQHKAAHFANDGIVASNEQQVDVPATLDGITPSTAEGYSIYSNLKDGKASIEHQIEINVIDLVDVQSNKDISLEEIMDSLRYVMEYRIKGGRYPSLDYDTMKRLAEGLLLNMGNVEKHKFKTKLTEEADVAFQLFGEFLLEVQEFRAAVGEKPVSDLRHALKLDVRCGPTATEQEKKSAVALIALLTSMYPQFSEWRELVKSEGQPSVQKAMKEYADLAEAERMPNMGGMILAPQGLPAEAIPSLQEHYGKNILPQPPAPSVFKMLINQLKDFIILLLLAVAILNAATKEYIPMAVLLIVVVLNTIIGFTQEYKASKALDALTRLSVPKAQVLRDGQVSVVNSEELVPGDIVILEEGDSVPADLRLAEVSQLEIIESVLTGESVAVVKDPKEIKTLTRKLPLGDCRGNAFMSTVVAKGRGKGIVVRTGRQTEMGKISAAISGAGNQLTPVQRKLAKLGKLLVLFAIVLCALIAGITIAYKNPVEASLKQALSLAVSVIPEGLVAVVTVTMAVGVRRMAAQQAIVRTLPAVETLGGVTFICSDKTGTLTEGKMGAAELWTSDGVAYGFTESTSLDPNKGDVTLRNDPSHVIEKALDKVPAQMLISLMVSSLCNNSSVVPKEDTDEDGQDVAASKISIPNEKAGATAGSDTVEWKGIGDPTEVALVVAAQKAGFPKTFFHELGYTRIYEQAFDSERKMMSVVYKAPFDSTLPEGEHFEFVLAKGAPEEVLNRCVGFLPAVDSSVVANPLDVLKPDNTDVTQPVTEEFYDKVSDASGRMADNGLRVLGLAYKRVKINGGGAEAVEDYDSLENIDKVKESKEAPASTFQPTELDKITAANANQPDDDGEDAVPPGYSEHDLVFLGLIGLIDPARAGVKESVRICKEAGITVVMITGDHIKTASAIARELGILSEGGRAIKGEELDLLSEQAIAELKPFPNVFARVSPDNKLKLVQALKSRGESVAMTGDGVNDAPAIKAADIGVAMGIAGTDITKQAADIVLANDNFNTIKKAVEEGRRVFDNILKFIVYLLSCNCAEIFLFLLCSIINVELPFTVIMILWANIIADVPPALALGVEPPERGLMSRPPRSPKRSIITLTSLCIILYQSMLMMLMTFGVYMWGRKGLPGILPKKFEDTNMDKAVFDQWHAQEGYAQAEAFAFLTTLQLLQGFLSRTIKTSVFRTNLMTNKWMIIGVMTSFVLMLLGLYVPGLNDVVLELQGINGISWAKIVVGCIALIMFSEVEKFFLRRFKLTL